MIPPFPDAEPEAHQARLGDPARLMALNAAGLMDSLPEEAFDRVVRLATSIAGVPVGLFSLVDDKRQYFKARTGLAGEKALICQTPLMSSFCQYVVTADAPLAVTDARTHPLLQNNGAIQGLDVIAYLGTPIHAPDGQPIGSLCAIDHTPRDWTDGQLAALRDLAAIVETELALRQSMQERALILNELNHRVKNLFAIVGSMVRLSRREHDNAADMASDLEARVGALARAHQLIVPTGRMSGVLTTGADLADLLNALLLPYDGGSAGARVIAQGPDLPLGPKAMTSLALAFHELATNSVKYGALAHPDGVLRLTWLMNGEDMHLHWDEAMGASVSQINGAGFGSQLIEMTIEGQLQGDIRSEPTDSGLCHRISIPAAALTQ